MITLTKHPHCRLAANACFVSQPTFSTQIRKLEDELDMTLVTRNNKRIILVEAGLAIVERAVHIINATEDMKAYARLMKNSATGHLKLGLTPTVAL